MDDSSEEDNLVCTTDGGMRAPRGKRSLQDVDLGEEGDGEDTGMIPLKPEGATVNKNNEGSSARKNLDLLLASRDKGKEGSLALGVTTSLQLTYVTPKE